MTGGRVVRKGENRPAATLPVARVYVDVPLAHLDRPFDYLVPESLDEAAVPGCRLRMRFAGKQVDGFLLERVAESEFGGRLEYIGKVVSSEPVLTPEIAALARGVADRYAGMMIDVLRLAIPPRHAKVEGEPPAETPEKPPRPETGAWTRYPRGPAFVEALRNGRQAHAVWQALPGEDWPARLAELAATAAASDRGALLVMPDYRDVERLYQACVDRAGDNVVVLAADAGPAKRYRAWLGVKRGAARIVVGTRASVFAPIQNPGLFVVWDDGDDLHADPHAPYPHVRDVLIQRAHTSGASLLVAGFARTAEAQLLVESGWAPEIIASRDELRKAAPRITSLGETDQQLARDPAARAARIPSVAFEAAREALKNGHPVLVQVPRGGYVPALACQQCRGPARCRRCAGPLGLPTSGNDARPPTCRWCGVPDTAFRCNNCGSRRLRAIVVGAKRTAEELGRAFADVPVVGSGGAEVLKRVDDRPALVVATPGAEPVGKYGAALLLDGWALLGRADLRATEETLRRWMAAAAMVRADGRVVVLAESALPAVQALVRWDPVWHASQELAARTELGFPPAVRMASVDGSPKALAAFLDELKLPASGEVLGPVPIGEPDRDGNTKKERALVRATRAEGRALSAALTTAQHARTARKEPDSIRVRLDPLELI
jgi:primosomal protein N' (replication factor Y) (superfamily II helicase)